jgi:hypothetical protein
MQDFLIKIATRVLMAGKEKKLWLEMDNGRAWRTARKVQGLMDYRWWISPQALCGTLGNRESSVLVVPIGAQKLRNTNPSGFGPASPADRFMPRSRKRKGGLGLLASGANGM